MVEVWIVIYDGNGAGIYLREFEGFTEAMQEFLRLASERVKECNGDNDTAWWCHVDVKYYEEKLKDLCYQNPRVLGGIADKYFAYAFAIADSPQPPLRFWTKKAREMWLRLGGRYPEWVPSI